MKTEIIAALIGAGATVIAAYFPILSSAEKAAEEKVEARVGAIIQEIENLDVVTAGSVAKDGTVVRHSGYPFTVAPRDGGRYRVNFRDPFKEIPVVVATSDGGDRGAFAEITSIDTTGFLVEGRTYSAHGLAEIGFEFVAVQSIPK